MRPPGKRTYRLIFVVLSTLLVTLGAVVSTEGKDLLSTVGALTANSTSTVGNATRSEHSYKLKSSDPGVLVADSQVADSRQNDSSNSLKQAILPLEFPLVTDAPAATSGNDQRSSGSSLVPRNDTDQSVVLPPGEDTNGGSNGPTKDGQVDSRSSSLLKDVRTGADGEESPVQSPPSFDKGTSSASQSSEDSVTDAPLRAAVDSSSATKKGQTVQLDSDEKVSRSTKAADKVADESKNRAGTAHDSETSILLKTTSLTSAEPDATETAASNSTGMCL